MVAHVPFPWGLLAFDVGGTIVSTGAALAATDETTAISCGFIACLFLAVTVLQIAAWGLGLRTRDRPSRRRSAETE